MKAVLVMEMQENCEGCPMEMEIGDTQGHILPNTNICRGVGKRNMDSCRKPDWCPLVPVPGRKQNACSHGFAAGWNACLDAIEGSGMLQNRKQLNGQ